ILVLDEPLNGLDPQGIRWLRTFLREQAASGKTVLLSSHVLSEVAQTVDDVVVIHKGRLVHQGSIDDLARFGDGGVLVSTPTRERLAAAGRRGGGGGGAPKRGGGRRVEGWRGPPRRGRGPARASTAREPARGGVLHPDRRGGGMIALLRGEMIKTLTTRTVFGYGALGVALIIANVLTTTRAEALPTR